MNRCFASSFWTDSLCLANSTAARKLCGKTSIILSIATSLAVKTRKGGIQSALLKSSLPFHFGRWTPATLAWRTLHRLGLRALYHRSCLLTSCWLRPLSVFVITTVIVKFDTIFVTTTSIESVAPFSHRFHSHWHCFEYHTIEHQRDRAMLRTYFWILFVIHYTVK